MAFIDFSDAGWDEFFPDNCAILSLSTLENDLGEQREIWAPLENHGTIGAALEFKSGEVVANGQSSGLSSHTIHLRGFYPLVKAQMRAQIGAQTFSVLASGADSQGVKTRLLVELLQ